MEKYNIPHSCCSFVQTVAPVLSYSDGIEVIDNTSLFEESDVKKELLPDSGNQYYMPWGADNQLPFELNKLISDDEVTAQNKLFNTLTCYGAGVTFNDEETGEPSKFKPLKEWLREQSLPTYFLEQCTDMKHFYFTVTVLILSNDNSQINRIVHKDACFCRFAPADAKGKIPYVYYGLWNSQELRGKDIERIPLLDVSNPYGDLLVRTGHRRNKEGQYERSKDRKFAVLSRFPTVGCSYYPQPYWTSIFKGGSYDYKKTIQTGKRAKLKNGSAIKYHIEVERGYYDRICTEENIVDPVEQKKRVELEKANIEQYVMGIGNSGKSLITKYYVDPYGHEQRDVRITVIEGKKEGGEWAEDEAAAINTICFADNIYPDLPGAVPGKTQNNTSGTDKREMFTIKQSLEIAYHDVMLQPLNIVCWFNGWPVVPTVPMIQLTTLDEHKDSKKVNVSKTNKEEENGDNH